LIIAQSGESGVSRLFGFTLIIINTPSGWRIGLSQAVSDGMADFAEIHARLSIIQFYHIRSL